ncbi:hypothetical protein WJX81_008231 [Elliptochloris bilobata]|uniref:Uncharacterized protein n=1 Tax=Elliptochloris bilobata TaxID=381761 RepID=A0AAW1QV39_9CHLO
MRQKRPGDESLLQGRSSSSLTQSRLRRAPFAKNDRELFYASAKVTLSTLACYKHNRVTFIKPFGGSDLGW